MTEENTNFGGYLLSREDITPEMWLAALQANFGFIPGEIYTRNNTERKYEFIEMCSEKDSVGMLKFRELDTEYEDDETLVDGFVVNLYFNRNENKDD